MARYFVQAEQIDEAAAQIVFHGRDVHHMLNVLRLGPGDRVTAIGPDGSEYEVVLGSFSKRDGALTAQIQQRRRPEREPRLQVTIAQALVKHEKFDWIVQKSTELGVTAIIPFQAARSIVRLTRDKQVQRVERWRRIAMSAAQQSGRARIPHVHDVLSFDDLVARIAERGENETAIVAWEGERAQGLQPLLASLPLPERSLLAVIGPEGGFELDEVDALRAAGAVTVSLGPLILRAETVAPVLLSLMLYEAGDLGRAPA